MRRLLVPFLVTWALVVVAASAWAGSNSSLITQSIDTEPELPIVVAQPPTDWIEPEIVVTDLPLVPAEATSGPAADQCSDATPLVLSFDIPATGGATLTNGYTEDITDPSFVCMFGLPVSTSGFRTAWYELVAEDTSRVTITTEGTDYDTVLGIYSGSCDSLDSLACSDDNRDFQSSVSFPVVRGQSYFVLVADYKPGIPTTGILLLSAVMEPGSQFWNQVSNSPVGGITRHAFAHQGANMYLIGGQTRIQGVPQISNRLIRYNVQNNTWAQLADVPGSSLSNTTAVRLGNRIYVPGGFNGNTSSYINAHLVYDIPTDFWRLTTPIPTQLLPGNTMFAWASAAAPPDEQSYYVTGGVTTYSDPILDPNAVVLNNTYRYIPSANQWQAFTPMSVARYAHTAAWVSTANRGLCVAGGLSTGVDAEGDPAVILITGGECINPAFGSWQPTGPMNFPRYQAGSAIGPDGNWYVFGGMDGRGSVPETEVYDPVTNQWRLLPGEYNLGGQPENPARVWPRGAFAGGTLFIFGGNDFPERRVISSVEQLTPGPVTANEQNRILMPFAGSIGVDNFLGRSTPLPVGVPISDNFVEPTQFYNAYYFDWPAFGRAVVRLSNIPSDSNFNVAIYDGSKVVLGEGNRALYGGEKIVPLTLIPGRYFIVVERIFPRDLPDPNDFYQLVVTRG
ncbi:MAG: kelch repeat-containing protein [Chloroflexota bacterium]